MTTHKKDAIKRIKAKMSRIGIDALLLSDQRNIEYLAGFYSPGAILLVVIGDNPIYFVDTMNKTLAEKMIDVRKLHIVTVSGSVIAALAGHIRKNRKIKKIGYNSENLSVSIFKRLKKSIPKVRFTSESKTYVISSIVKDVRKIKTPEEINILRKAAIHTIRIWRFVKKNIEIGMSEKEIACMVNVRIHSQGYRNSFPTIVAIGKNTAYPHAMPTDKCLGIGEHVLLDFGIKFKGYCSDLTRTWYDGRINRQIKGFRESVLKAHNLAIKLIKPGVVISSVVDKSNNILNKSGFGDYILHGLGHGIGLDVHEWPFLDKRCNQRLQKGMVFTVEPGLYKPGLGGVREEDMILVTTKGCEVLTDK